jgi:2'-5' RNA ligase
MSLPIGDDRPRRRLFLALYPQVEQRQQLARVVAEHCPVLKSPGVRPVPIANLHMTLVFLGAVTADTQSCVEQVAATLVAPVFELSLDRLGYWSRKHMLWAMPDPLHIPNALTALVESLNQGLTVCDVQLEQRLYRPHVTLARQLERTPRGGLIEPVDWTLDHFALMESVSTPVGVQYSVLRSWPLAVA